MEVWTGSGRRSTTNKKWIWGNKKRMLGIWVGGRKRKPIVTGPGKAAKSRKRQDWAQTHTSTKMEVPSGSKHAISYRAGRAQSG